MIDIRGVGVSLTFKPTQKWYLGEEHKVCDELQIRKDKEHTIYPKKTEMIRQTPEPDRKQEPPEGRGYRGWGVSLP